MTEEILDPLIDAADDAVDDEEGIVIEFMDEETGEKFYFEQEMVLEVNGERYALLVEITDDECGDHECDCGCGHDHDHDHDHEDEDEDIEYNIRFAKLVKNADGEDEYVEPTDEEFAAAVKAYDELWDDEDEE